MQESEENIPDLTGILHLDESGSNSYYYLISELLELGLSRPQAKIYVTALSLGKSSAVSIAKNISMDRAFAYRIIDGLTKLGLIQVELGNPNLFVARDPRQFIEEKKSEFQARLKMADEVASNLEAIREFGLQRDVPFEERLSLYHFFRNRRQFMEELQKILPEAKTEVLWMGPPRLLTEVESNHYNIREIKELSRRRVSWFGITDVLTADPAQLASVSRYCKIRHHRALAFTLIVVDRRIAAFGTTHSLYSGDTADEPYIFIDDSTAAKSFAMLFEALWKNSKSADLVQGLIRSEHVVMPSSKSD